ncbi:uncharacterized protein LODBEIA_P56900 [Lodderomyces beijingensis]|uniref:Exocyst complex component Sec10-like alpha-helical bundle domain-containing protein n=1 Tax=Lodderomyces beijingensis TaxID=1775926 RepID=A0ABP0ZI31_9ASCO
MPRTTPAVIPSAIARRIASFLPVRDLLVFGLVSRSAYEATLEPRLWVSLLQKMGVWDNAVALSKETIRGGHLDYLGDPLTCLDYVYRSAKNARYQVLKIHRALGVYYYDLVGCNSYDRLRIFQDFHTPEEQMRMLKNLQAYNRADLSPESRRNAHGKLCELLEIFENAVLREIEIHFDLEEYPTTKRFAEILVALDNQSVLVDFFLQKMAQGNIEAQDVDTLVAALTSEFRRHSHIVHAAFPADLSMMYKVCEELMSTLVATAVQLAIVEAKEHGTYLSVVPQLYHRLATTMIPQLAQPHESYQRELLDMVFAPFAAEYIREQVSSVKEKVKKPPVVSVTPESTILSSLKSVFSAPEETPTPPVAPVEPFTPEAIMGLLDDAKTALSRLSNFQDYSIHTLRSDAAQSQQEIITFVMDTVGSDHLRPGFDRALAFLQSCNPKSPTYSSVEPPGQPLVLFFDLINTADTIIQMVDRFCKEVSSTHSVRKLEVLVDTNVAEGLNIGIEVLVHQIETIYTKRLHDSEYDPASGSPSVGPTEAAQRATEVLSQNMNLLVDSAEGSVVDVFQQELAERFFQTVVKVLKGRTVSMIGAPTLIADLNLYFEVVMGSIRSNKRVVAPLFSALKQIGNVYLISGNDSKAIGRLVSDLSKFNGIFNQEEIYEFVQRRKDWADIRKDVEKVMYGFGLGDCKFM